MTQDVEKSERSLSDRVGKKKKSSDEKESGCQIFGKLASTTSDEVCHCTVWAPLSL